MTDDAVMQEVERRAVAWLPGDAPVRVERVSVDRRTFSHVHHLRVCRGDAQREVVVKVARPGPTIARHPHRAGRPLLIPPPHPSERATLEADALRLVAAAPGIASDPELHPIEVLADLESVEGVVLERIDAPTLRDLTNRALLTPRPPAPVLAAHRRAGRWLRAYHGIDPVRAPRDLRGASSDALALVCSLCEHLAAHGRPSAEHLATRTQAGVHRWLPVQLPMGLRHDDFAPRNVLVREGDVVVIDVLARFRAPTYEDLGCYVSWLRSDLAALASRGLLARPALRSALEDSFLRGYFGTEPVPTQAIRVHELITTLDRACAWVDDGRGDADRARRLRGAARRAIGLGPLLRRAEAILAELERR